MASLPAVMASPLALSRPVRMDEDPDWFDPIPDEKIVQLSGRGDNGFLNVADLRRRTGIGQRKMILPGKSLAKLCLELGERVCSAAGTSWKQISHTWLSISHPDPQRTERLERDLHRIAGVRHPLSICNRGCNGFLEVLNDAATRIRSGTCGPALLLAVESPHDWHSAADRSFAGILSAGAAGVVLGGATGGWSLLQVATRSRRFAPPGESLFELQRGVRVGWNGQEHRNSNWVRMNGPIVRKAVQTAAETTFKEVAAAMDPPRPIRWVLPHQASGPVLRDLEQLARQWVVQARLVSFLDQMGNSLSASLPTALALWEEHPRFGSPAENDLALLLGMGADWSAFDRNLRTGHALLKRQTLSST